MQDIDLSVVIPTWNEARNLPLLISGIRAACEKLGLRFEILVVDGGSKDGTEEVARSLGCEVVRQTTPGYGGALREGFARVRGAFVLTLDADLSHPPALLAELWQRRQEAEVVIASRYVPGGSSEGPLLRRALSRILNLTFAELLNIPARDLSSGMRLYRREALDKVRTDGVNFNVLQELLVKIHLRGGRIVEVPLAFGPRLHGSSHARLIRFGLSYLRSLANLFALGSALFQARPAARRSPYLLIIALAVLAAYSGALGHGFVRWDDDYLVFENPAIRSLAPESVLAMFDPRVPREKYGSQYAPLSDLSYAIDWRLFGSNARAYHVQGLVYHFAAAALLFLLVERLTRSAALGLVSALLFALHPVAVESVAWISGRRSVLSPALMLAASLAFLGYRERGSRCAYAASLALAVLANLAKQGAVSLPLILLAIDWFFRGRTISDRPGTPPAAAARSRSRLWAVAEYAPHFAIAAAFTAIGLVVGARERVVGEHPLGVEGHVTAPLCAIAYYARMLVLPSGLRPTYGLVFDSKASFVALVAAGGAIAAAAILLAFAARRREPACSFGIACAGSALAPALAAVGTQVVAERYLYLSVGFAAIAAAAFFLRLARTGTPAAPCAGTAPPAAQDAAAERALVVRRKLALALLAAVLCVLFFATHERVAVWRDDLALWEDAAAKEPLNRIARRMYGRALAAAGRTDEAERELRLAAALAERMPPARGPSPFPFILADIAALREARGDLEEAERLLHEAVSRAPCSEQAAVNLGDFFVRRGNMQRAAAVYRYALERDPDAAVARARLEALGERGGAP